VGIRPLILLALAPALVWASGIVPPPPDPLAARSQPPAVSADVTSKRLEMLVPVAGYALAPDGATRLDPLRMAGEISEHAGFLDTYFQQAAEQVPPVQVSTVLHLQYPAYDAAQQEQFFTALGAVPGGPTLHLWVADPLRARADHPLAATPRNLQRDAQGAPLSSADGQVYLDPASQEVQVAVERQTRALLERIAQYNAGGPPLRISGLTLGHGGYRPGATDPQESVVAALAERWIAQVRHAGLAPAVVFPGYGKHVTGVSQIAVSPGVRFWGAVLRGPGDGDEAVAAGIDRLQALRATLEIGPVTKYNPRAQEATQADYVAAGTAFDSTAVLFVPQGEFAFP
jgi:hypothetical protein